MKSLPKVGIIGCGYIGIISAVCYASKGMQVVGIDLNAKIISDLVSGKVPIHEPGLDVLFQENRDRLSFSDSYADLAGCDFIIVTVATPTQTDGVVDLNQVTRVMQSLTELALDGSISESVLVFRSTMPPGTMKVIRTEALSKGLNLRLLHYPEFLREGSAIEDLFNPPRVVIGAEDVAVFEKFRDQFLIHFEEDANTFLTSFENSEYAKYVDNSWHALKVAFGNEVAAIANKHSVNIRDMYDIFVADNHLNISARYLRPGAPYGGSCLRKDTDGLKGLAKQGQVSAPLICSINDSNYSRIEEIVALVKSRNPSKVLIEGLSFKVGTSDVREAVQLDVISSLSSEDINICVFDPVVEAAGNTAQNFVDAEFCATEKWDFHLRFHNLLTSEISAIETLDLT
ncbi:MAG: nucleotide sugar dehydrogenase [Aequoribacter sp.]|uniref:nucleotide sugar dehydrogenase n=1 Tax=Aequoribacter sp. TaxID=2847771 RepID=UPI003C63EB20